MVHHEDVRVGVPTGGVGMHDHHVVRRVHPLDELRCHVTHAIEVVLAGHIELVGMEGEHVGLELDLSPVSRGEPLRTIDERGGSRATVGHRYRERRSSGFPVGDELLASRLRASVEDVVDRSGGIA